MNALAAARLKQPAGGLLAAVPGYPVTTPATVAACGATRMRFSGSLDPLGDHRAACANARTPLEPAVARVYQEAGTQVARNVRLADMDIDVPVSGDRRIEVVANELPLWHGSQQAMDATIVSLVTRAGDAQPGADARPGQALVGAARRKRRQTPVQY